MKTNTKKFLLPSKFIYLCLFTLFFISFASAGFGYDDGELIGNYNQGKEINLIQTCSNCTFNNITTIRLPDGSILNFDEKMNKDGTTYNWTLDSSHTSLIGEYTVNGIGDLSGNNKVWNYRFEIKGGNLWFFALIFVLTYGLTFYGLKIKNEWVSLIGCFGLSIFGIYTSFNGIDIYKNLMTNVVSYINIGVGLGIGFEALREITYK